MFSNGAMFEVKLKIKIGDEEFAPGLRGKVTGSAKKWWAKHMK